ncbi:hypothetical protein ACFWPH_27785 [Nocardia sp. NPDC058499]|uniref:hypothetical protein n=1 Tax=Nocardia sp. NPDC058499 TaxID=3346530 RepID=UPI00365686E7
MPAEVAVPYRIAENRRRAIVVRSYGTEISGLDELIAHHCLEVVFTVFGPSAPKLVTLIAVQHIFEHNAEVVVISHLTAAEIRAERLWQAVTGLADIVAADGTWLP